MTNLVEVEVDVDAITRRQNDVSKIRLDQESYRVMTGFTRYSRIDLAHQAGTDSCRG